MTNPGPLPYHVGVRDHFRAREPGLWKWFRERETSDALREGVRLDLLKTAYRLEPEARPELYATVTEVAEALELTDPITLYQSQSGELMNARLCYAPGEIHVVFAGPMLERAGTVELRALLGHELTHYRFWTQDEGEFLTTVSILNAQNQAAGVEFAHAATARNFDLYTEILCDRGALQVVDSPLSVIAMLVKVETGLSEVDPEAYLRQAEEIFAKGPVETAGVSHPETFVRARALMQWAEQGEAAEAAIAQMIEGPRRIDGLDLPGQVAIAELTRDLIQVFLDDEALRTPAHEAQAHLYFDDFDASGDVPAFEDLCELLATDDAQLRDYFCYVLIDFIAVDRESLETALVRGLAMFAHLGWRPRLAELVSKELGLRKREMEKLGLRADDSQAFAPPAEESPAEEPATEESTAEAAADEVAGVETDELPGEEHP